MARSAKAGRAIFLMAHIPLSTGGFAVVDEEDVSKVAGYRWRLSKDGYACATKGGKVVFMHEVIMPALDAGMVRDHQNGNRLDNRKINLRQATRLQNSQNAGIRKDNSSGFKGVYWNKQTARWRAQIRHAGRRIFLGGFDDPGKAARAYDAAAKQYFGEFARLNFQ